MIKTQEKIIEALSFLYSFNQELKDFDEDFLESSDLRKILVLKNKNPFSLDETNLFFAKNIITKYKNEFDYNYDLSFIEKIIVDKKEDFLNKSIKIENDFIYVSKEVYKNSKNLKNIDIDKTYSDPLYLRFYFDLYTIFPLVLDYNEKNIFINKSDILKINDFILKIDYSNYESEDFSLGEELDFLMFFQKVGVIYGLLNKNIIFGDEMGLGKTLQAISLFLLYKKYNSGLVICPASLQYIWRAQIKAFFPSVNPIIVRSGDLNNIDVNKKNLFIINYESLKNYEKQINNLNISFVAFDEIHYIKNPKAIRTKKTLEIVKNTEVKIGLSGSCVINKPIELATQLEAINVLKDFGGYWSFTEKYCPEENERVVNQEFTEKKFSLERSEALGKDIRKFCYIRRTKKEVAKEIPDKQRTFVPIEINNKYFYYKKYDEYIKLKNSKKATRSELGKKLSELNNIIIEGKAENIIQNIKLFEKNKQKVVVFCLHKNLRDKIVEAFPNALHIFEEDSFKERAYAENKFQNDENSSVLLTTIGVGYSGYTLNSSTNVIMAEFTLCSTINEQCEDRCHRIGTKDGVNIWYFYAQDTLEELKINKLTDKSKVVDSVNKNENESNYIITEVISDFEKVFNEELISA